MMELVAPAGSPEALDAAIGEGADAVYLGLKDFNARMNGKNFTYAQYEGAARAMRRNGKKLYVAVNTVFEQREADRVYQLLKFLDDTGPDAIIVQDFGVVAMARSCFPALKLHASTQMNIASCRGVNALSRHGVSRVVLARELSLAELQAIRAGTNMELEVFVHGALCISASGLCLFSGYYGGKSANRGMCTQACRRLYHRAETEGFADGGIVPASGYYFSPCDLQLLQRVPDLAAAGINALKIEGRMKSADYVGTVVSAYRMVVDAVADGDQETIRRSIERGQEILHGDFARPKTEYFFSGEAAVDWLNPEQDGGIGIYAGSIIKVRNKGNRRLALVAQALVGGAENTYTPQPGDTVRLHRSDDSKRVTHKLEFAEKAEGPALRGAFWISVPDGFTEGVRVYLIQIKALSKRYRPAFSHNKAGGRMPGREKAPLPELNEPAVTAGAKNAFPEGLYVAVSRTDDLFIVQSVRPERVMLSLNSKTRSYLISGNKPPLPFRPAELILVLPPWFPQAQSETLAEHIGLLVKKGYKQFVANNPGHFSLFRAMSDVKLIAGPWLYMFNRWAISLIAMNSVSASISVSVSGFISPFENNRQNLERTVTGNALRSKFFVPVFAWPPLFHMQSSMENLYNFTSFSDSRDENFSLLTGPDGSVVIPQTPFSITDKIPFLKEAGFKRFIIDLNGPVLRKSDYRDLMRAVTDGTPLPRISRFNWKDGFFQSVETKKLPPQGLPHTP